MSDASHAPGDTTQLYFPQAEWEQLQADDRHAGAAVLGLMAAIFSIGLVLYLIVLFSIL